MDIYHKMVICFKSFCNYFVEDVTSTGATITMETIPLMHSKFCLFLLFIQALKRLLVCLQNKRYFVCVYTADVMKQFFPEV